MTRNTRPALLLDIDGVLNIWSERGGLNGKLARPVIRERTPMDTMGAIYSLNIPTDTPDLLAQLDEWFDIYWYTMWNERAKSVFTPLARLPKTYPYYRCDWSKGYREIARRSEPGQASMWESVLWVPKTPLVPAYLQDRPFVWVDDDHGLVDAQWLAAQPEIGKFDLITTSPHMGLTQEQVDRAIMFAMELDEELYEEEVS